MSQCIKPQPGILNIKPYVGGEDIIPAGYTAKVMLSSNENPLGASSKVIKALQDITSHIHI
jgi:histidinol-phosphate aminotransferase